MVGTPWSVATNSTSPQPRIMSMASSPPSALTASRNTRTTELAGSVAKAFMPRSTWMKSPQVPHPYARHLRRGLSAGRGHPLHETTRRLPDEIAHVEPDGAALRHHRLRDAAPHHAHVDRATARSDVANVDGLRQRIDHRLGRRMRAEDCVAAAARHTAVR